MHPQPRCHAAEPQEPDAQPSEVEVETARVQAEANRHAGAAAHRDRATAQVQDRAGESEGAATRGQCQPRHSHPETIHMQVKPFNSKEEL